jgi:phosphatidylglycerol---prolipoprotein diacylglyceryl transferase
MIYYLDFNPVAFTLGSTVVSWYGIMVALAVITLVAWALLAVKRGADLTNNTVLNAAIVGVPSGIIVSRLMHVLDFWDYYMHNPGRIIGGEGLSIWGAVLGAALGVWIFSRFSKIKFGYLADVIAPGIILAQAIGRVGCTINGCCYGIESHVWSAVIYTNPNTFAPNGIAVLPTMTYEIFYDLAVFAVLLVLRNRFRPAGSLFLIYLSLYSVWRLGIDFIREGTSFIGNWHFIWPSAVDFIQQHLPWLYNLHQAQWISIVVLIIAITLMVKNTRWIKKADIEPKDVAKPEQPSIENRPE